MPTPPPSLIPGCFNHEIVRLWLIIGTIVLSQTGTMNVAPPFNLCTWGASALGAVTDTNLWGSWLLSLMASFLRTGLASSAVLEGLASGAVAQGGRLASLKSCTCQHGKARMG